ncbi:MAG: tetratricopeptide repeat protein, partial [Deltaproteobacteria bacterium]|nr:tetratricopeptide repeat protein [Deltaproteobacteria bacterium]
MAQNSSETLTYFSFLPRMHSRLRLSRFSQVLLMLALVLPVFSTTALAKKKKKKAKPTVAVATFSGEVDEEYQWIAQAVSESLTERLMTTKVAEAMSETQWRRVLLERDVHFEKVASDDDARHFARQVGASTVIVGGIKAKWPDVTLLARRLDVESGVVLARAQVKGTLDQLSKLEKKLAKALFKKELRKAVKKGGPPKKVLAWRSLALCKQGLSLQGLGPFSRPWLPAAFINQTLEQCKKAVKLDKKRKETKGLQGLAHVLLASRLVDEAETDEDRNKAEKEAKKHLKKSKKLLKAGMKAKNPGLHQLAAFYALVLEGKPKKGEALLKKAIKKAPGFLRARFLLAESQMVRGDLKAANRTLKAILKVSPSLPWARVLQGRALAKAGKIDEAIAITQKAVGQVNDDRIFTLEKASREIDGKRWEAAEKTLSEALSKHPGLAKAYVRLGWVYLQTDKLDLAEPILQKAVQESDVESERRVKALAYFDLAIVSAREKDNEGALAHLKSAKEAGFADKKLVETTAALAPVIALGEYAAIYGVVQYAPKEESVDGDSPKKSETEGQKPDEPDAEKPDAEKPDAEKPDAEKPDAEKPDAEKPDAEKPDAE